MTAERGPSSASAAHRFAVDAFAPIAVAARSGLDESLHHGVGIAIDAVGDVIASVGDPSTVIYPRSALKPFQTSAMLSSGLELPHRLLAVVIASHSGEAEHLAAVREILDRHGLDEHALRNTPTLPIDADAKRTAIEQRIEPASILQNCSGKHAGMLATCAVNGWDIDSHLDVEHPLQRAIVAEIDRLVGRQGAVEHIGVDGCGAPTHALALHDVARALGTLGRESSDVLEAMAAHPHLVGGTDRDVTVWMRHVPGLAAKEGAAGVMVLALPDGRAAALKVADGSDDVRRAVVPEVLRHLRIDVDDTFAHVGDETRVDVLGHGTAVGTIRALPWR